MALPPTSAAASLAHYRAQFPVFRKSIYLNSCSLGPLSHRCRAMIDRYLDEWDQRGASAWYDTWLPALDRLRAGYAEVIGAQADSIALHPSISSALTAVAESLDYRLRPRVVTTALDFPDRGLPVAGQGAPWRRAAGRAESGRDHGAGGAPGPGNR